MGYARGLEDTSVCISAAKLPFEAGGKEDTGKKEGGRRGEREKRRKGCERKKSERKERQRDSGEEEERTAAAAAAATTARLNANSFIDWNSKSLSFDSCNHLLHPFRFTPLLSDPPTPRSAFPSACRVSTSPLSSPTFVSRFSSPVPLRFPPCSPVLLLSRTYPYARLLHKRGRICIRGRACSLAGGYARHRASPPPLLPPPPPPPLSSANRRARVLTCRSE